LLHNDQQRVAVAKQRSETFNIGRLILKASLQFREPSLGIVVAVVGKI
jgi:hypothetical protein